MVDHVTQLVRVARSLADGERMIDLNGLDEMVGRLCAQCIDLPQETGKRFRSRLATLLTEVDALSTALGEVDRNMPGIPVSGVR